MTKTDPNPEDHSLDFGAWLRDPFVILVLSMFVLIVVFSAAELIRRSSTQPERPPSVAAFDFLLIGERCV